MRFLAQGLGLRMPLRQYDSGGAGRSYDALLDARKSVRARMNWKVRVRSGKFAVSCDSTGDYGACATRSAGRRVRWGRRLATVMRGSVNWSAVDTDGHAKGSANGSQCWRPRPACHVLLTAGGAIGGDSHHRLRQSYRTTRNSYTGGAPKH